MAEVEAQIDVPVAIADVWDVYFDADRWANWVDGFARVLMTEGGYPEVGGSLAWESGQAGRGRVGERVVAHEERRLHVITYEDPGSTGTLETRFEMVAAGEEQERATRVSQKQTYELRNGGLLGKITDKLFIRSQMRQSLERSLVDLRSELVAAAARGDAG